MKITDNLAYLEAIIDMQREINPNMAGKAHKYLMEAVEDVKGMLNSNDAEINGYKHTIHVLKVEAEEDAQLILNLRKKIKKLEDAESKRRLTDLQVEAGIVQLNGLEIEAFNNIDLETK